MMAGWIKLYRKITDSRIWKDDEPFSKRDAWIDILLMCNYEERIALFGKQKIAIKSGSFLTSQEELGYRWHWGRQKVRSYLKQIKELEMVEIEATKQYTIISVPNYERYQGLASDCLLLGESLPQSRPYEVKQITKNVTKDLTKKKTKQNFEKITKQNFENATNKTESEKSRRYQENEAFKDENLEKITKQNLEEKTKQNFEEKTKDVTKDITKDITKLLTITKEDKEEYKNNNIPPADIYNYINIYSENGSFSAAGEENEKSFNLFVAVENALKIPMTHDLAEMFIALLEEVGEGVMKEALKEATKYNGRSYAYVEAVARRIASRGKAETTSKKWIDWEAISKKLEGEQNANRQE